MKFPAISVIIPLYNAEKYIGECLKSLLIQTFQDFEVIVVDDCSTDNSVAVVQNYAPKFNGRLQIAQTEFNSGGGGYVPRNIGLKLSHGEYIYFMDADDFIVETALEIFYMAATQENADVVYTSACYFLSDSQNYEMVIDEEGISAKKRNIAEQMTLTIDNPGRNLRRMLFEGNFRNPWTKFLKREFLIKNKIDFPTITSGGDFIWCIQVFANAKRFLRLPIALYFYRNYSAESISRKKRSPEEHVFYWVSSFVTWLKALNELANKTEILKQNPSYCYMASNLHFKYCFNCCFKERMQLSYEDIYNVLCREFAKENNSADLTIPFLFSVVNVYQREYLEAQKRIAELETKFKE